MRQVTLQQCLGVLNVDFPISSEINVSSVKIHSR